MRRAIVVLVLLLAQCSRRPEFTFVDLAATFSDSLVAGARARPTSVRVGNREVPAVLVPGSGVFKARLVVPADARLSFAPMLPPAGSREGDVRLWISIRTQGRGPETLWESRLTRRTTRIREVHIDLARFEGARVELGFGSESPRPADDTGGWAVWGLPRITSSVTPRGSSSLVLLTIDTLRSDRLGCYGDTLAHTPVIDRLAEGGVRFTAAYTAFNVTNPSLATLHTGLYGRDHGVYNLTTPLGGEFTTMAEMLKGYGYRTGAVVSARHMAHDLSGLAQGFDHFEAPDDGEWRADETTERAILWVSQHAVHPFFLWVHYFDPHMLYAPPDSFAHLFAPDGPRARGGANLAESLSARADLTHHGSVGLQWLSGITDPAYPDAAYRAEIAFVDQQIGRLLEVIRARLLEWKVVLVLTADHGESMGEHEIYYDHIGLFGPQVRIPLIFYGNGLIPTGGRRDDLVSTVDLLPTVCDLLSIAPSLEVDGFSFARTVLGGAKGPRTLAIVQHADNRAASMRTAAWALQRAWLPYSVVKVDTSFYDLTVDPEELDDRSASDPRTYRMVRQLGEWLERARHGQVSQARLDEATRQHLVRLGYLEETPQ